MSDTVDMDIEQAIVAAQSETPDLIETPEEVVRQPTMRRIMDQFKYWLRWLAVLPGALLGGLLLCIPLHFILYRTLTEFIDPYPELPERILSPFAIAVGVVWFGAKIAPTRKIETAVVLLGLWMVLVGCVVAITIFVGEIYGQPVYLHGGGLAPAMAFIGAVIGFLAVRKAVKETPSTHDATMNAPQAPSRERVIERTATGHVPGAVDEDQASMDEILSKQGHEDAAQTEAAQREHEFRESELQFGDAADSSDVAACQDLETLVASEAKSERPPQTTFSPLIVGVVALWVILATNPTTRPFVSFLGLVLVINVTHVCATAVTGLLSRVPIKEIRLFYGPNLAVVLVGPMVVRVGSIPIGGSVHFWEDERQDKPSERGGRVWPLGWKLALHLSGPLAVFLVSSICMGSLEAGRSLVTGFFQVVLGGFSPLSEGPVMIKKFADLFRSDFVTALGVLCAKWVAFHLLPIPPANGGMALLAPFQNWLEKSKRAESCYMVVCLIGIFFVCALSIGWSIAIAKYALDGFR